MVAEDTEQVREENHTKPRLVRLITLIVVICVVWFGSAVFRLSMAHKSLTRALTNQGGYRSNSVDPKPFLNKSELNQVASIVFFMKHPFSSEANLIYRKGDRIVCRASRESRHTEWYLDIPEDVRLEWKNKKLLEKSWTEPANKNHL